MIITNTKQSDPAGMASTATISMNSIPDLTADAPPTPPPRSPKRKPWNPDLPPDSPSPPPERLPSPVENQYPWGLPPIQEADEDDETHPALIKYASQTPRGKSLSMRVARSAHQIQGWVTEIEDWRWDGTFEASRAREKKESSYTEKADTDFSWRRIPIGQTIAYHTRVEAISRELLELDMEEQKMLLLQHYLLPASVRQTKKHEDSMLSFMDLHDLDDLTALLTLALLQTLPHYEKLRSLLSQWKTRLAVVSQVPGFLAELYDLQRKLTEAWCIIGMRPGKLSRPQQLPIVSMEYLSTLRTTCDRMRTRMQQHISMLWQKLDVMLDLLEYSEDALPDKLVNAVMDYERHLTYWHLEAQKRLSQFELRMHAAEHNIQDSHPKFLLAEAAAAATVVISFKRPTESPKIVAGNQGRKAIAIVQCKIIEDVGIKPQPQVLRREPRSVLERPGVLRRDSGYGSNESDGDSKKDVIIV